MRLLWHTNSGLKGAHWVLSRELGELLFSPKQCSARFRSLRVDDTLSGGGGGGAFRASWQDLLTSQRRIGGCCWDSASRATGPQAYKGNPSCTCSQMGTAWRKNQPEPEEPESGTGTAGTGFQEPKPEPEPSLSAKLCWGQKSPFSRGNAGTENQNRSNRSTPKP